MYNVEKGIELPEKTAGYGCCIYPFKSMEIGDSFFVEVGKDLIIKKRSSILASLNRKRTGMVFTTRTVDGGLRVWRVE